MSNSNLSSYNNDVTSEHGEDGVIEKIFEIIGEESRWCVDLGALNGVHGSTVWHLMKKRGWDGVRIEADKTYFEKLQKNMPMWNKRTVSMRLFHLRERIH
jgi:hypothetical protein